MTRSMAKQSDNSRAHQADSQPDKLALYREAVQHPDAEVSFFLRVLDHYHSQPEEATRLKEDFGGSAAVSCAWVQWDDAHQAMAVDLDQPTLDWGLAQAKEELGQRIEDLHLVCDDVLAVDSPVVDIIASLNFSTFIYHTYGELLAYFQHAWRSLDEQGVFVMDAFGGPGAMRPGIQRRAMKFGEETDDELMSVDYLWEQKSFKPVTGRIDCRIHFEFEDGSELRDAFCYDWRLWTLPELTAAMTAAGFSQVDVWCDELAPDQTMIDPTFAPRDHMHAREDWVVYVVGQK